MVAMRNEMVDACIAEPRQRSNLPYIAPIDAVRQPVPMPDICQSRTFRLMECGVFPFFLKLGVTITSSTPAINKRIAIKRMEENGIRTEPKSPKWSMTRLNSSCPNRGKIVVCNCPSARNRQIVMVTVHRAMMPPVQLHQGVLEICAADGSKGIPAMTEIIVSSSEDTMNEMRVTTHTEPMLIRKRAFAAVWMGTSIPINNVMKILISKSNY